jgi:hypothetical protein
VFPPHPSSRGFDKKLTPSCDRTPFMILSRVCCPLPLRDEAQCSRASRAHRPRPSRPTSGREIQFGNSKESIIMWVEIYGRRKKTKKQKRKLMTGIVSDSNRSAFCSSLSFVLYLGGKFKQNKKVFFSFFFFFWLLPDVVLIRSSSKASPADLGVGCC